jgi:cephalosporin hydroxylase/2-polyprenyl-3-methyl-5-hydroxy-6-metoxy-1,4-benzoquinol methylase
LRRALAETVDLEGINDLAVLAHQLGRADEAEWLLRAVLAIEPAREDAVNNLTALAQVEGHVGWRRSRTLGGPDPAYCERAFPGMPRPDIISEHCSRYSFALSLIGGLHVLDLGCGTGYGSEMLSWSAASVRGFDLWQPGANEHPRWPGVLELNYGHDLCLDPLPHAEAAVMFEVIEHLPDAPQALEIAWSAVGTIIASFPNPVYHGSFMNRYHVNDWSLDRFERELERAALAAGRDGVSLTHYHQPLQSPLLVAGRDPDSSYWIVVARATDDPHTNTPAMPLSEPTEVTVENSVPRAVQVSPETPIKDYWRARAQQHTSDRYLGIKTSKFPEDLRVYEHLMWVAKPTVIVEIGAQSGGSTLWLRDRLRTLYGYGVLTTPPLVVSVDIDMSTARRNIGRLDPDWAKTIVLLEGDVCNASLRAEVGRHIEPGATCLVIEDSAHVAETTRAALELYSDLVPVGGFFVVEDGCIDIPWMHVVDDWPLGVLPALQAWLTTEQGSGFRVRRDLEVYGISCHPSGFLQRVS